MDTHGCITVPLSTLRKAVFVDPAPNAEGQGDAQAFVIVGCGRRQDGLPFYVILHAEEHNGISASRLAARAVDLAVQWHAEIIGFQDYTETLYTYVETRDLVQRRQLKHIRVVRVTARGDKIRRMVGVFEPLVSSGRLFATDAVRNGKWGQQFAHCAVKQKNDDLIDAASLLGGTVKAKLLRGGVAEVPVLAPPPPGYRDWSVYEDFRELPDNAPRVWLTY